LKSSSDGGGEKGLAEGKHAGEKTMLVGPYGEKGVEGNLLTAEQRRIQTFSAD